MDTRYLKRDFVSSLVVFLVALPLSLGIALASGATAKAGIISAIIGGILVGWLSGAPLQVSGPAAGLSVIVFGFIQTFGFEKTCIIASLAGLFQIAFGLLKVSRVMLMIAPAVIHGMLAGIGVLIAMGQIHVIFGGHPFSSGWQNLVHYPETFAQWNGFTLILGLVTIAILVGWKKVSFKWAKVIPGSLIAVVGLTGVSAILGWDIPRVQLASDALNLSLGWVQPEIHEWVSLIIAALSLMAIASAESLLSAIATDRLHSNPKANLDKELIAQGCGNLLAGAVGGLPITGVIVRSAANISSGAATRLSTILHGIWILLFVWLGKDLVSSIPLAVLAGLLVHVGINLVKLDQIQHLKQYRQHGIYFATLFGVVFLGLLNGIGVGLLLTVGSLLVSLSRIKIHQESDGPNGLNLNISGALTFLSAPQLSRALECVPEKKKIKLNLHLSQIDLTALEMIRTWKNDYEKRGGFVSKPNLDEMIRK